MKPSQTIDVLVVDDDPGLREALASFLTVLGYRVRTAADGAEALREVEAHPPHLLLLDQQLPILTGLEVLRHLRATGSQIPAVLISGALDAATEKAALTLGAIACLRKPIGLPALERCLTTLLPVRSAA